jgi:hypothetical protein
MERCPENERHDDHAREHEEPHAILDAARYRVGRIRVRSAIVHCGHSFAPGA